MHVRTHWRTPRRKVWIVVVFHENLLKYHAGVALARVRWITGKPWIFLLVYKELTELEVRKLSFFTECPNHDIWCLRVQENYELKSSHNRNLFYQTFRNPKGGFNTGPLDLKFTALPPTPRGRKISEKKIQVQKPQVVFSMDFINLIWDS